MCRAMADWLEELLGFTVDGSRVLPKTLPITVFPDDQGRGLCI